jgi:flagellar biosynthetic protein FliO
MFVNLHNAFSFVMAFAYQSVPPPEEINFGMLLLRTFFFLALVLLLIVFVLKKVIPHVAQVSGMRNRNIRIIERLPVDAKKSLIVVEVQDKAYLMGCSENAIAVLMELDRSKIEVKPAASQISGSTFDSVFKKIVFRSKSGGSHSE